MTTRATIQIEFLDTEAGDEGTIYKLRRIVPNDYIFSTRYRAYLIFEFDEMLAEFRHTIKEQQL